MAFLDRFKKKDTSDAPPLGVNLENSSFGYEKNQNSFKAPTIPEPNIQTKATVPPQRSKGRPGGGWEDDSEDEAPKFAPQQQAQPAPTVQQQNPVPTPSVEPKPVEEPPKKLYEQVQLSRLKSFTPYQLLTAQEIEAGNYEYEQSQVTEAVKLGGVRLKQSDIVLKDFATAAESLQEQIIGSILINQLQCEENPKIQARVAYAIEHLVIQLPKYKKYFEMNIKQLNIRTNQSQLTQTLDSIRSEVQGKTVKQQQDITFEFIEPPKPVQESPPIQAQTQKPSAVVSNILDLEPAQQQPQKKNAFGFINKAKPAETVPNLLSSSPPTSEKSLLDDQTVSIQNPVSAQESVKKANAFGFIKKTTEAPPQQIQQVESTEEIKKPNSFQFLKKKEQPEPPQQQSLLVDTVQSANLIGQAPPQSQQQQPYYQQNTPQAYPQYPYPPQNFTNYPPPQYTPPQYQPQYPPPYPQATTGYPYPYPPQQVPYPPYPYPPQQFGAPYYPPYGQQIPNQSQGVNQGASPTRVDEVKLQSEKQKNKDESAFDFIKI